MASDLFLISPLAFLIPLAPAYPKLTHHKPVSSLFSFSIICSMMLQTIRVAAFQISGQYLTNAYFPSEIFTELRTCWGEFDDIQERKPKENDDEEDSGEEESSGEEEKNNNGESEGGEGGEEEEGEDDIMYQECIDNSTNFYISFAQYLILAVVFCTGKPFKKSIFYNYGMFIFSIIGFIYAEYIVFYVDIFSRKMIKLTAYPDDPFLNGNVYELDDNALNSFHKIPFKYIIMLFIVANFVCCLFIEKVIVPKCNKKWRKIKMKRLRRQIELDVDKESSLKLINNVKNYIREKKEKNEMIIN